MLLRVDTSKEQKNSRGGWVSNRNLSELTKYWLQWGRVPKRERARWSTRCWITETKMKAICGGSFVLCMLRVACSFSAASYIGLFLTRKALKRVLLDWWRRRQRKKEKKSSVRIDFLFTVFISVENIYCDLRACTWMHGQRWTKLLTSGNY